MLRRLYDKTMALAAEPQALWFLGIISFIESSIFPIPPDVLLIPMVLADRTRAFRIAFVCTLASVLGGVAGYAIGYFLFETIGRPLVDFYGAGDAFAYFQAGYNQWGGWIVAGAGFTPFPYKVVTILSGVTALDMKVFFIASLLSRGARFYLEALLLWRFGEAIRAVLEKNLPLISILFFTLLFGGFVLVRYVF